MVAAENVPVEFVRRCAATYVQGKLVREMAALVDQKLRDCGRIQPSGMDVVQRRETNVQTITLKHTAKRVRSPQPRPESARRRNQHIAIVKPTPQ